MPELPETETIKLGLQKHLVGHKVVSVDIGDHKLFQGDKKDIIGATVSEIERFGKGIVINFDNGFCLAIHIKLTGQIVYAGKDTKGVVYSKVRIGELPNKFTHIIFNLDEGAALYYNDVRRFGWLKVIKRDELTKILFFKELGPEPFKDLNFETFTQVLQKANIPIKPLLLDQKRIAGIGNIYSNDGLFLAGIDPRRKAKTLSTDEIKKLYDSLLEVLKRGLTYGGASELNFVNALGQDGEYQKHFLVYARQGKPCKNNNGTIRKFVLGGRGTYMCDACQK